MSKIHEILLGTAWTYGAQVSTIVIQFAYAAITSRVVGASGFGTYGVALSVAALISILANGGLGQAVGRMQILESGRLRALGLYAGILGVSGAAILFASADLWAALWSAPEASEPTRWLCLSALLAPWMGLVSGLLRRQNRFRLLAIIVLLSNVGGMALGTVAVMRWANSSSLLVSPILAILLVAAAGFVSNRSLLFGRAKLANASGDIAFSWKLTLASLLSYLNGNVGKLAVSRALGLSALGQWNRADVVTSVPFLQVQGAMINAIYPEFRHDIRGPGRAATAWPDLLTLVAWLSLPIAATGSILVPYLVPIFFGPGWELAAQLSAMLSLIAGVQVVTTVLASAIEALGKFAWIWSTQLILLAVYGLAAYGTLVSHQWYPVLIGLLLGLIVQHSWQVFLCVRAGYLELPRLLSGYAGVVAASIIVAGLAWGAVEVIRWLDSPWDIVAAALALVCLACGIWTHKGKLPPVKIAQKYGLFGPR